MESEEEAPSRRVIADKILDYFELMSKDGRRWYYVVLFVFGIFPALVSGAFCVDEIIKGTYSHGDVARFHDIITFVLLLLDLAIDVVPLAAFKADSGRFRRPVKVWDLFFKSVLICICIIGYAVSPYLSLAFLSIFRIRDWVWMVLGRSHPFSEAFLRSLYMTGCYTLILIVLVILFALIGYHTFRDVHSGMSPFSSMGHAIVVVSVYVTGGRWMTFQNELDAAGYPQSKAFAVVFIGLSFVLFTVGYIAFVADSAITESRRYEIERQQKCKIVDETQMERAGNGDEEKASKAKYDLITSKQWIDSLRELTDIYATQARELDKLYEEFFAISLMQSEFASVSTELQEKKLRQVAFDTGELVK